MTINFKEQANFIWSIADLLRGDYKQSEYGKVILPLTVLRRLDCVLEPTKKKVMDYLPKAKGLSPAAVDARGMLDCLQNGIKDYIKWI